MKRPLSTRYGDDRRHDRLHLLIAKTDQITLLVS